jgi:hypothetical protein
VPGHEGHLGACLDRGSALLDQGSPYRDHYRTCRRNRQDGTSDQQAFPEATLGPEGPSATSSAPMIVANAVNTSWFDFRIVSEHLTRKSKQGSILVPDISDSVGN